jgi:hypothetical protein
MGSVLRELGDESWEMRRGATVSNRRRNGLGGFEFEATGRRAACAPCAPCWKPPLLGFIL